MVLIALTLLLLLLSFLRDRDKTRIALKRAAVKFLNIAFIIVLLIVLIPLVFVFLPEDQLGPLFQAIPLSAGLFLASLLGSVTMMPGFIAFPLGGILSESGVPLTIIAGFTTTLMMVGIATFPIEKRYFGTRTALLRNLVSFFLALIVSLIIGLSSGEWL